MKSSRSKKTILALFVFLSLLFLAVLFVGFLAFSARDLPSFDDSDFALPEREIDPAQNPYPEIRKMEWSEPRKERVKRAGAMLNELEPIDPEFVDSVLDELDGEFDLFEKYAEMTDWKVDGDFTFETSHPELSPLRSTSVMLRLEARRLIANGDIAGALERADLLLNFGIRMQNGDGTLIHHLVGVAIFGMGHLVLLDLIDSGKLGQPELQKLAEQLDQFEVTSDGLANALRTEYQTFSTYIDDFAEGKVNLQDVDPTFSDAPRIPNSLIFKRNRTKHFYAECLREMIGEISSVRKTAPRETMKRIEGFQENKLKILTSGNAVGMILVAFTIPALDSMADSHARVHVQHDLLRVRVALERFRIANGDWPPNLEALVPDLIQAVPVDRFDGSPLRYKRDSLKIYSVGYDFIDSGGEAKKDGHFKDRKEIVIELKKAVTPPGETHNLNNDEPR